MRAMATAEARGHPAALRRAPHRKSDLTKILLITYYYCYYYYCY